MIEQDLKEEWTKALKDKNMFTKDVYAETANWWLSKRRAELDRLLGEIESIGEKDAFISKKPLLEYLRSLIS